VARERRVRELLPSEAGTLVTSSRAGGGGGEVGGAGEARLLVAREFPGDFESRMRPE
jgi:hypothetical protein